MNKEFLSVCKKHGITTFVRESSNRLQRRCKKCRVEHVSERSFQMQSFMC
jgi:hypothetical protein